MPHTPQRVPKSAPPMPLSERRRAARVQLNLPAHYASGLLQVDGWVSNLAPGGMFVRSSYLDQPGASVGIRFSLPNEAQEIAVRGKVVRVEESPLCPGMAVQFTTVAPAVRAKLSQFLASRQ